MLCCVSILVIVLRCVVAYPYRVSRWDNPWKFSLVTCSRKFPFSLLKIKKRDEYMVSTNGHSIALRRYVAVF